MNPHSVYEHIVLGTDLAILILDGEQRILAANPAAQSLLGGGWVEEQRCLAEAVEQADRAALVAAIEGWFEEGSRARGAIDCNVKPATQPPRLIRWRPVPLPPAADGRQRIGLTGRDVTDTVRGQRELRQSEQRVRAILAGVLDPLVIIDGVGTIQHASASVEAVFAYQPNELVGQNIRVLMPEPHRGQHDGYLQRYRQTGKTNILGQTRQFEVLRKDGQRIVCDLSVARVDVPDQSEPYFVGTFRDVTDKLKAAEQERRVLGALAQLGESAAMLAHEIKTPITAVNLALRAVATKLGEDDRSVLEDLVARLKRVERTLRQTLSFAKPLDFQPGPIESMALLRQALESARLEVVRQGVQVELAPDSDSVHFVGDADLLAEALLNLIHNAVHALPVGGHIRLSSRATPEDRVELIVEDDGPGIPPDVAGQLFRPFFTTRKQGTGLGLAITKRTAEAHGGQVEVGDSSLGGARFLLRLPRQQESRLA